MQKFISLLIAITLAVVPSVAFAGGNELAYKKIPSLETLSGASLDGAADYIPVYDASAGKVKKVLASVPGIATTASAAELNYNDITTLGTGAASKSVVLDASGDYTYPATGTIVYPSSATLTLQSGSTFDVAGTFNVGGVAMTSTAAELNYNDVATLGTLAASKAWTSDASLDTIMPTGGKLTVQSGGEIVLPTGSVLTVDTVAVNHKPLAFQARGTFSICGDATTVNNNTVYYGPSQVLTSSATAASVVCDSTQAGNTTEATADAPALPATAIYPLGMVCYSPDSNNTITYTLRSAEGAITPAISVSIADNVLSGTASATATSEIASGATVAIAVASSGNIGTVPFRCDVAYAY